MDNNNSEAIKLIPPVFDQPGALFVFMPAGTKFPPIEKGWENKGHSFQEAAEYAARGGNVGAMAGNGHIGLDQDDPAAFAGLELPITTTWETRPGRLGMRFTCTDRTPELLAKYGKTANHAQFKLFKNGESVGEVKLERTYQVIPPSWKILEDGTRADYKMLQEVPPAAISLAKLLEDLQALGITFSKKAKAAPLMEGIKEDAPQRPPGDEEKSGIDAMAEELERHEIERQKQYAEAAFKSEIAALRSAKEGNRNQQLNDSTYKLAGFIGMGLLDSKKVFKGLYTAALAIGLEPTEIEATAKSAYDAGVNQPRDIPAAGSEPRHEMAGSSAALGGQIETFDRPLQDITQDAFNALVAHNSPPEIFARAGNLVRLSYHEKLILEPLSEGALRGALARSALFSKKFGKRSFQVSPPLEVVRDILSLGSWQGLPEIRGIIETPVIRPDGSILSKQGYDESTKLYLNSQIDLSDLNIPDDLTKRHAEASAKFILDELFIDFPFKDEASKSNALALLISVIARPMIDGNIPIALLDKPRAGTGASLIADIVSIVSTGRPAAMWGMPESEDEWRKSITSALVDGSPVIVIDNIVGKFKSAALTRALTSKIWRDRLLGQSRMLDLPQTAVWIASGNNIEIGGDIARRAYWIRIDAACARPWLREGFKHPDILGWIKANHSAVLAYILIMARAWSLAGRPTGSAKLGGFNEWASVVSGILEFAGVTDFLGNATELYDSMDQDVQQWDAFLGEWTALHGDRGISAGQLREELTGIAPIYLTFQDSMPDDVSKAIEKERRASLSLGVVLRRHLDQVYPSGRKLTQVKNAHSKVSLWSVVGFAGSLENQKQVASGGFAGSAGSCSSLRPVDKITGKILENTRIEYKPGPLPALPAEGANASDQQKSDYPQKVAVLFKTNYKTDWPKEDGSGAYLREFLEGDKEAVPVDRALAWEKRGVVSILEAGGAEDAEA